MVIFHSYVSLPEGISKSIPAVSHVLFDRRTAAELPVAASRRNGGVALRRHRRVGTWSVEVGAGWEEYV